MPANLHLSSPESATTPTVEPPQTLEVTVLLAGGHQQTLSLPVDSPLPRQLLGILSEPTERRAQILFQIPIKSEQAMLCFPGDRLAGVITEPPLALRKSSPDNAAPNSAQSPGGIIQSGYVQIDNFLQPDQVKALLEYTLSQEAAFTSSSTSTDEADYRKSLVLYSFPEVSSGFIQRLQPIIPQVADKLGLPPFPISQIESQMTAHNDGHYYQLHNDNGSPDTATRRLTYVYYFRQEPNAFSGGELRLFDSKLENNFFVKADSFKTIEPRHNSIIFFPSYCMHEVLPIQCPSRKFADSRFTINGWVRD